MGKKIILGTTIAIVAGVMTVLGLTKGKSKLIEIRRE